MGDATGLASDICDILEMSELVVEVLKAVRAHVVRGLRAMGAARSSERVVCENMVGVFAGEMLDKALSMSLSLCYVDDDGIMKSCRISASARLHLPTALGPSAPLVSASVDQHLVVCPCQSKGVLT